MIDLDDDRLAEILADIGQRLVTGPVANQEVGSSAGPVPWTMEALTGRRRGRVVALAALGVVASVIAVIVTVAPLRSAVADWLGLGSTRIQIQPPPSSTQPMLPIDAGLRMIDRNQAEQRLGAPLPMLDDTALGVPAGFAAMPEGGVLVVWPDGSTLWIHVETIDADVYFDKLVTSEAVVQRLDDLGDSALLIIGDHFLQTPHRTVAAGTAVLWRSGDVEYRLESARDATTVISLARRLASS